MSRIHFRSPSGDAEVLGAERAHAGIFVRDVAARRINASPSRFYEPLRELSSNSHLRSRHQPDFFSDFLVTFAVQRENLLAWRGHEVDALSLALNTALELGDDVMKLVARLHGQCEIHGYVEGKNRGWLVGLIERGLAAGVLRDGMGWDAPPSHPHGKGPGVVPLLRQCDDEPVVMSYSVCASFPHAAHSVMTLADDWKPDGWTTREWADLDDGERDEYRDAGRSNAFGTLPTQEQWARGMMWLRERSQTMLLEWKPKDWDTFRFGHMLSVLDLEADDWQARVERALGLDAVER